MALGKPYNGKKWYGRKKCPVCHSKNWCDYGEGIVTCDDCGQTYNDEVWYQKPGWLRKNKYNHWEIK